MRKRLNERFLTVLEPSTLNKANNSTILSIIQTRTRNKEFIIFIRNLSQNLEFALTILCKWKMVNCLKQDNFGE